MARTFSSPLWIKAMVGVFAIGMPVATALLLKHEGFTPVTLGLAAMSVVGLAVLLEVAVLAVSIDDDALRVRGLIRRRDIPRSEITKVTWESGSPVSVQLTDGTWVKMPEVGRNTQALANSLRAWVKRGTQPGAD